MRALLGVGGIAAVICAGGAVWAAHASEAPARLPKGAPPVIVELFSSEGCSSCPPAEAWLAALDRAQPIDGVAVIALEEHVDYWDRLGWRDRFARPELGERQQGYARALSDSRVYTPEIVIDGHAVVENGDEARAAREMRASAVEPRARLALARQGDRLTIDVSEIPGAEPSEVWLALTESGLASDVAQGENAGKRLAHAPVVRDLRRMGLAQGGAFRAVTTVAADPAWAPGALRVVAFVQRVRSRRIVGVAVLAL